MPQSVGTRKHTRLESAKYICQLSFQKEYKHVFTGLQAAQGRDGLQTARLCVTLPSEISHIGTFHEILIFIHL